MGEKKRGGKAAELPEAVAEATEAFWDVDAIEVEGKEGVCGERWSWESAVEAAEAEERDVGRVTMEKMRKRRQMAEETDADSGGE